MYRVTFPVKVAIQAVFVGVVGLCIFLRRGENVAVGSKKLPGDNFEGFLHLVNVLCKFNVEDGGIFFRLCLV